MGWGWEGDGSLVLFLSNSMFLSLLCLFVCDSRKVVLCYFFFYKGIGGNVEVFDGWCF